MSTPIKSAAAHPAAPVVNHPPPATPSEHPATTRNPLSRPRPAGSQTLSNNVCVPPADSQFFEQLLVPPPPDDNEESGSGGGAAAYSLFTQTDEIPLQWIDELAVQLTDQGLRPFSATLLMPGMGKVQIRAQKYASHWAIELGLERSAVLKRLKHHQHTCEGALSQAMGRDVELTLQLAGDP